jgi:hypothetical protein
MSALPPKADIRQRIGHVCFVPQAEVSGQITTTITECEDPCSLTLVRFSCHECASRAN